MRTDDDSPATESPLPDDSRFPWIPWGILLAVGLSIWMVDSVFEARPDGVEPWGWRLLAVFVPTILGLMLRPLPGGAVVLLGVLATLLFDALPPGDVPNYSKALAGYMNKSVWLVLAAYFLSRAIIKTGLARRIALLFVRALGGSSLGLSYALVGTDTVLAAMIPSNAARVGGVVLPITRSLSELYKSYPGRSAALIGTFLMLTLYQCDVIACSLFLTGQASNPLAAARADEVTGGAVKLTYGSWFLYASAPALVSLLVVPWLVYRFTKPELKRTPEAVDMAKDELRKIGPPRADEWIMIAVFLLVCSGWISLGGDYITMVALCGVAVLLITRVLTWQDVVSERQGWDVFIWYGGLVQLGSLLNQSGVTYVFARSVADNLDFLAPALLFVLVLLIYFYAHYGFASITAHIVSMYPAFVGVLLAAGMPPWLVVVSFAYFSNLCAGLTHYGTTPGPIIFSTHYVAQGTWWRVGFVLSVVNIVIFLTIGLAWWKLWGLW